MNVQDYDVIVAGFGNAAQTAAFAAYETGARVLVLEKAPQGKRGGNTWFSHGAQFRHVHNGIADVKPLLPHVPEKEWEKIDLSPYTKDEFYSDVMRVTRGRSVPELAELLVNESYPTVKWMRESGIQWEILYSAGVPENGRFRWHHGSSFIHSKDGGAGLVEMWHRILQNKGVEIRFGTAATRLLTDDKGRVYGVVAQNSEGFTEIRCKGLVLCKNLRRRPGKVLGEIGRDNNVLYVQSCSYVFNAMISPHGVFLDRRRQPVGDLQHNDQHCDR